MVAALVHPKSEVRSAVNISESLVARDVPVHIVATAALVMIGFGFTVTTTVFGAAEAARMMAHDNLRDAVAERIGEHRGVAMQLAIELDRFENLAAIGFVAAIEVVQPDAARPGGDSVEDF